MELRYYWAVIRRRWWILAILLLLTLAFTLISQKPWQPRPPAYALGMSFSVGVRPQENNTEYNYDGYYSALASEYLIDDFAAVVKGSEFANAVSARLADQGISVAAGTIQGSTQTGTLHRILQLTVYGSDPDQLQLIADAAAATLEQDADQFMPRLLANQGAVYLINRGGVAEIGPGLRQRLDLPLRLALAFVAGIGLIFLLEYLDDRIRGRADLEALGISVMGEVPRK
ncbi:MAG: hypothetical protein J5I90_00010 [Caldilineales bacterium]|nr:hypothetical protein [Caldilineales bacterium]